MASKPALPALTGLRFIAAAQVVGYHVRAMIAPIRDDPAFAFLGSGYSGVSLFFVLSGFVLAYNYLEPDGPGVTSLRDFFAARFARIYPVYLLGVALGFPIFIRDLQRAGGESPLVGEVVPITTSVVALVQAWIPQYACRLNCPGWSLSAEAFFYLLFPAVGLWLCRQSRAVLVLTATSAWLAACGAAALYIALDPDALGVATAASETALLNMVKYNPLIRFTEFVMGIAAGIWFLRSPRALARIAAPLSIVSLLAIITLLALHQRLPYLLLHNGLLAPLFMVFIMALATGGGPIARVLGSPHLHVLGEASFALYLLHIAVLVYVFKLFEAIGMSMDESPALVIAYLLIVQALSIVVLTHVEEPARRAIRARFGRRR